MWNFKSSYLTYDQSLDILNHNNLQSFSSLSIKDHDYDHPNLDNLPNAIYYYLFNYLDLDDVFELRCVSRRLRSVIKSYEITELYFIDNEDHWTNRDNWFSTTKFIKLKKRLHVSRLNLLTKFFWVFNRKNHICNLVNLKYLKIKECPPSFRIDDLTYFTKLRILQIDSISTNYNYHHYLELLELEALSIYYDESDHGYLEINAPNLTNLDLNSNSQRKLKTGRIRFRDSKTIKYLKARWFDDSLFVFSNLECLEIRRGSEHSNIDVDISEFRNLKKIKITSLFLSKDEIHKLKEFFKLSKNDFNRFWSPFTTKSYDLEFVLNGVRIKKSDKINEYRKTRDNLKYQLANYNELEDDLDFVKEINYNHLLNLLTKRMSNLFKNYTNIQEISTNARIKDEKLFIRFIAGCKNLYNLFLKESVLSQRFYDLLPFVSSLSLLIIEQNHIDLNFAFVIKMSYLTGFCTDQDVTIDENLNLNKLKYLERFVFEIKSVYGQDVEFGIDRKGKDKYTIENSRDLGLYLHSFTFADLIIWSNYFRYRKIYNY